MAAPQGNQNAAKAKVWSAAITRALERRAPANERIKAIDELADKLLAQCDKGSLAALQELGNRLEGKPAQSVIVGGDEDNPLNVSGLEAVYGIFAAAKAKADSGESG